MTKTDERYEKILKSLESAGGDFDEFGDVDKKDLDNNFQVPDVQPERKAPAPENWDADVLSLKDLQRMRDEDESGVQAQKYASTADTRKSTEDWDDVISMKELIQLQNEDSGKFSGKKFDGNSELERSVTDASYTDMLRKKQDLDKDPTMPHAGYTYQDGQEIDLEITEEGDGYEEPYGALMEPAEDEEDDESFSPEAFKEGDIANENPEFKFDGKAKGIVNANDDMKGINTRKFWDEAIPTDDEDTEQVEVGYNPHPNKELDMPKADFKKKLPKDDLEGIESKATEVDDNMLLKIQDGDINKLDSWEEGSMGDIWTCPECGFKSASKDEYDDHSNAHGISESFNFEDLGTDEDILSKFRND